MSIRSCRVWVAFLAFLFLLSCLYKTAVFGVSPFMFYSTRSPSGGANGSSGDAGCWYYLTILDHVLFYFFLLFSTLLLQRSWLWTSSLRDLAILNQFLFQFRFLLLSFHLLFFLRAIHYVISSLHSVLRAFSSWATDVSACSSWAPRHLICSEMCNDPHSYFSCI